MADRIEGVNRSRIEWCCDEQQLTVEDLFHQLKFSEQVISNYMADEPAFTFIQLEKVANYFNRGVLFFLERTPPDPNSVYTPQFRTIANQKPEMSPKVRALVERAERHREIFISVQEELGEDQWDPWERRLPTGALEGDFHDRALVVRNWLKLDGINKWSDYRAKLEEQGILVFVSNGYNGQWQIPKQSKICGFSLVHERHPLVLIKKQQFEAPMVFTMFHELAHLILHDHSFADDEEDLLSHSGRESEANRLAGMILLPDHFLDTIELENIRINQPEMINEDLLDYRRKWGISSEVILRRLLDNGYIEMHQYEGFRNWCSENPPTVRRGSGGARHRYSEPLRMFGSAYVGMIIEAVSTNRVTLSKATSFLDNIKVSDFHRLEERCVSS